MFVIPPDGHDTKFVMYSETTLEDHYKNGYGPLEEEIGILMFLECKEFKLDYERVSFELEGSNKEDSIEDLLQLLSHSAISELQ